MKAPNIMEMTNIIMYLAYSPFLVKFSPVPLNFLYVTKNPKMEWTKKKENVKQIIKAIICPNIIFCCLLFHQLVDLLLC